MKKILIPTDFSDAASNAARFMAAWTHYAPFSEIILLHSYAPLRKEIYLIDILESEEFDTAPQAHSAISLQTFRDSLLPQIRPGTRISMISTASGWEEAINGVVSREDVDLVAVGILPFGKNTRETIGKIVGEHTRALRLSLIMIPSNVSFFPIDTMVLACDLIDTEATLPIDRLTQLFKDNPARIFVVNVDADQKNAADLILEETALFQMLGIHQLEFHHIDSEDVVTGILSFARDKRARLIISIPKEHSFFDRIFHSSVSQHLAESGSVPVMLLYK